MSTARYNYPATLLLNGKVLVAGGINSSGIVPSTEVYDPVIGKWTATNALNNARFGNTATLLPNGKVLIAGGAGNSGYPANAELYDAGLNFSNSWRPQITAVTSPLALGGSLVITGSQFRGISGGSGGNTYDSPGDVPLVQLRSIENGLTVFLSSSNWSTNSFVSLPVWNFPPGYALATAFVNGIQSTSSVVNLSVPVPIAAKLTGFQKLNNGSFSFTFTNNVGALFGVLATTNLALPLASWTALGSVTEISPGQFQFVDPQATNSPRRFYRAYTP
jgi:hypothetical protein